MAKKIDYASLYTLRKDGRYAASYRDETGRHFVYDKDPKALHEKMQAIENREPPPLTFRVIAELWHDEAWEDMPEGTKASYTAHYNRAVDRFGDTLATEIYAYDINVHLELLKNQGLAASTIKKQRTIYQSIFRRAIIDPEYGKRIRFNPAADVKLPKGLPPPQVREAPEDAVVQLIQDKCTTAYFGEFAMFLMCTGMRRGEALAIQWKDIDFQKNIISVYEAASLRGTRGVLNPPKTKSGTRPVPILDPVRQVLVRPDSAKDTDFVFHGEDPSRPMPSSAYKRKWDHYCREMGFVIDTPTTSIGKNGRKYIKHHYQNTLTAHYLRHGYATILYEAGIDEKEAARLMGHADEEMLRKVYAHLRTKRETKAANKLRAYTKDGLVVKD